GEQGSRVVRILHGHRSSGRAARKDVIRSPVPAPASHERRGWTFRSERLIATSAPRGFPAVTGRLIVQRPARTGHAPSGPGARLGGRRIIDGRDPVDTRPAWPLRPRLRPALAADTLGL